MTVEEFCFRCNQDKYTEYTDAIFPCSVVLTAASAAMQWVHCILGHVVHTVLG